MKRIGGRIVDLRALTAFFVQMPDAGVITPWTFVRDPSTRFRGVVAHIELRALRHLREFDPGKRYIVGILPRVCLYLRREVVARFVKEGDVVSFAVCQV
ncbi:MAG: hypothetical protein IJ829_05385, partial [Kiritimatiellae bacterium]|nr:hypothetical protein [Kiritimatiellia bacterium]